MTTIAFLPEDAALLEELEDELVAARLYAAHDVEVPQAAGAMKRAAGLVAHLRRMEGGSDAVARVIGGGDAGRELRSLLHRDDLRGAAPGFLHHLAIFFDRVANAAARPPSGDASTRARSAARRDTYLDARTRSTAAFIALSAERRYLTTYARRVVGDAIANVDLEATALGIVVEWVDLLAKSARDGARVLSSESELALAALARARVASQMSGADEKTQAQFVRRATSARMGAIDDALAPLLDALAEARVREAPVRELVTIFAKVHATWVWSGGDDAVERFAVDGVTDFCWEIRRKHDLSGIGLLLAPCIPLYESLAHRIETDPQHHIGYASKCAQIYCFRSDAETESDRELAFAERAVKLCSTHRNGRATVAHILCNRAIAKLSTPLVSRSMIEAAKRDVARAEELWPSSGRLAVAKSKLAANGVKDAKSP